MQRSQFDLFQEKASFDEPLPAYRPLAVRMRPKTLSQIVGQPHLTGEGALLAGLIAHNQFGSLLLYGPPGSGKTTLAEVIIQQTKSQCFRLNAVLANLAQLRDVLAMARQATQERPVLFIDEIHRFNRGQQDLLLPDVEAGHVRLIGATTHNPSAYLIPALLSRSHLLRFDPVSPEAIVEALKAALVDQECGLGATRVTVNADVLQPIARWADGDLRRALNTLETLVLSVPNGSTVSPEHLESFAKERHLRYDRSEDEHYDTISAFIKSVRGSDPDAALYWLAKMLIAGEDPRFIARRLIILASEDIGLADSRALPLAVAALHACEAIGMPEGELTLAHTTLFLATCPKSNSAYLGIKKAKADIQNNPIQPVPLWLRDTGTTTAKQLGHGEGYRYSHDYPQAISGQKYMLEPKVFYTPTSHGAEAAIAERLKQWGLQ